MAEEAKKDMTVAELHEYYHATIEVFKEWARGSAAKLNREELYTEAEVFMVAVEMIERLFDEKIYQEDILLHVEAKKHMLH